MSAHDQAASPSSARDRIGATVKALGRRKLVRDASALYGGRSVSLVIGAVSILLYGVLFANEQIAVVSLFEMVSGVFVSFGFAWSTVGLTKYGKEEYLDSGTLRRTSTTRLALILPLLLCAIAVILLLRDTLMAYIGTTSPIVVDLLVLHLVVLVVNGQVMTVLSAVEKHWANVLFFVGQSVGKLAVLLSMWGGALGVSAESYITAIVLIDAALLVVRLPLLDARLVLPLTAVRREEMRQFASYALPQIYGFAGVYVINYVDVYFIRRYCPLEELGAYQFLYTIFVKITTFALILNTLLMPRIIAWRRSSPERLERFVRVAPPLLLTVMAVAVGAMTFSVAPVFDRFFDGKYVAAYPAFKLVLCAVPFYFVCYLYVPFLNAQGRVKAVQGANVAAACANAAIDVLLIRHFGVLAAGFGTFVAYFLKCTLLMVAAHAELGGARPMSAAPTRMAAGAALTAATVVYFIYQAALL